MTFSATKAPQRRCLRRELEDRAWEVSELGVGEVLLGMGLAQIPSSTDTLRVVVSSCRHRQYVWRCCTTDSGRLALLIGTALLCGSLSTFCIDPFVGLKVVYSAILQPLR